MSDPGPGFGPKERREARRFEPPPWERDQFAEWERQKEERSAAGASAQVGHEPTGVDAAGSESAEAEAPRARHRADPPDPVAVTGMLAELAAEEPSAAGTIWKASAAIGAMTVAIGVSFLAWGVVALAGAAKSGAIGLFGGAVVLVFGGGLAAGGVFVVVKNLRQRGVL